MQMTAMRPTFLLSALLLVPTLSAAQPAAPAPAAAPNPAVAVRAAELVPLLNGGGEPAALFGMEFLRQVPEPQLRALSAQLVAGVGRALRVGRIDSLGPNAADVTVVCERGTITLRMALDPAGANRIVGLFVTGAAPDAATVPAVAAALQALPGTTGFALADLGAGTPQIVVGHNADRPFAIGSAFKLVILAELVRELERGERRWDDRITLDGRQLSGGAYAQSPAGTQVTLRELAEKMISVSDNSATDLLLTTLGRSKVEAMQGRVGIVDPNRNRPFLSTLEAFKLKGIADLRERWLAGDRGARQRLLAEVDAAPISGLGGLFADGKPVIPDRIEWFLSPADIVRTLDWLRRHTERGPAAEARRILAINAGIIPGVARRFRYVGYKGGSEPGVIAMALLLQTQDGGWHAVTGSWQNPDAPVDEARFAALINRAVELAAH